MASRNINTASAAQASKALLITNRARTAAALFISLSAGMAIWAVSPLAFGHAEPWDGNFTGYLASLFGAGVVTALAVPRPLWASYVGIVAGQLAYMVLFLPSSPFIVLGAIFVALYSLVSWAGAATGFCLRSLPLLLGGRA